MTNRPIWILIPLALAILPFSTPLRTGALAGAGPDVINTVWAMWWFQQEWSGAAWGGHSTYFNFPFGGTGAILSPLSAVIWSFFDGTLLAISRNIFNKVVGQFELRRFPIRSNFLPFGHQ